MNMSKLIVAFLPQLNLLTIGELCCSFFQPNSQTRFIQKSYTFRLFIFQPSSQFIQKSYTIRVVYFLAQFSQFIQKSYSFCLFIFSPILTEKLYFSCCSLFSPILTVYTQRLYFRINVSSVNSLELVLRIQQILS